MNPRLEILRLDLNKSEKVSKCGLGSPVFLRLKKFFWLIWCRFFTDACIADRFPDDDRPVPLATAGSGVQPDLPGRQSRVQIVEPRRHRQAWPVLGHAKTTRGGRESATIGSCTAAGLWTENVRSAALPPAALVRTFSHYTGLLDGPGKCLPHISGGACAWVGRLVLRGRQSQPENTAIHMKTRKLWFSDEKCKQPCETFRLSNLFSISEIWNSFVDYFLLLIFLLKRL